MHLKDVREGFDASEWHVAAISMDADRLILTEIGNSVGDRPVWTFEEMVRLDGDTSNELFEVLADWNTQLEHLKQKPPVPRCP
ncbi:MAG: hypothetical protein P1V21_23745 [Rhizobiaceae bacterium]|nr:hypothetical protein [Rhizobiaceae bacterium]